MTWLVNRWLPAIPVEDALTLFDLVGRYAS